MYSVSEFIKWALKHVKPGTVPLGAVLPLPAGDCGIEPWHYLFGTVRANTTAAKLEERWKNYYSTHGWTRAQYDAATRGWQPTEFATDCQGLLDAYLTHELNEKTDINADMNYKQWCTSVSTLSGSDRGYVIGEAVFMVNSKNKATHVGWVCGFDKSGIPLVVEARGLAHGVVITSLKDRAWTHRGLMTRKFSYDSVEEAAAMEKIVFEKTNPMKKGDAYLDMQKALNAAGYTDNDGKKLSEDGKWGSCSQAAFDALIKAHSSVNAPTVIEDHAYLIGSADGKTRLRITVEEQSV